ncbi:ABC transporter ATP-binding protein [Mycoplasmatota bacterium WC44]
MSSRIKIKHLTKRYNRDVFRDFSIDIGSGINLLKGPNGSGKSTLIKCVLGLIKYKGEITVNGKIGYIPENYILPDYVTVESFIKNIASLTASEYRDFLIDFKLESKKDEYILNLSKGMKQKLIIIQALIHKPDIIICDEPINGLDACLQEEFIERLDILKSNGKTVIVATHYDRLYKDIVTREINL